MTYDRLFFALGDPTRRVLLEHIRRRPRTVGELARLVPISQPAVSQHLKVLRQAGLVAVREDGTQRIHHIASSGLEALRAYADSFWEGVLDAYQSEVGPAQKRGSRRTHRRKGRTS